MGDTEDLERFKRLKEQMRQAQIRYNQSEKGKATKKKYEVSEKGKLKRKEYRIK